MAWAPRSCHGSSPRAPEWQPPRAPKVRTAMLSISSFGQMSVPRMVLTRSPGPFSSGTVVSTCSFISRSRLPSIENREDHEQRLPGWGATNRDHRRGHGWLLGGLFSARDLWRRARDRRIREGATGRRARSAAGLRRYSDRDRRDPASLLERLPVHVHRDLGAPARSPP